MESLAVAAEHWDFWLVTIVLVVAAVIDGWMLKVPNWITFPFIAAGWIYSFAAFGFEGLGWSMLGTLLGLALLLPLNLVGGMGEGDVKLLAGVGAWVWLGHTMQAFIWTAIVGGVMSLAIVIWKRTWKHHGLQAVALVKEMVDVADQEALYARARRRKPRMALLPYGIPMAIGTIAYFAYTGLLF